MVWPDSTPPPSSIFFSTSLIHSSSANSRRSPASLKSCWAAKKVAEVIGSTPLAAMWASVQESSVPPMQ